MKRPVSVISPMYSASATAGVGRTPSPCIRSHTISAVHEASGTTWLSVPKRVLSWWWSMFSRCAPSRSTLAELRSMLPQSRNTTVRSAMSAGGCWISPSSGKKRYSRGSGRSSGEMNITRVLAERAAAAPASRPASRARRRRGSRGWRARSAGPRGCRCEHQLARLVERPRSSLTSARSPRAAPRRAARGRSSRRRGTRASACA